MSDDATALVSCEDEPPSNQTSLRGLSCLQVTLSDGRLILLDAGSGIRNLGLRLAGNARRIDILLTHLHLDHIPGAAVLRSYNQLEGCWFAGVAQGLGAGADSSLTALDILGTGG